MEKYTDSLDPSEVKDFSADWSGQLSEGEIITAIDAVTFIDAAGTTQPSPASFAGTITRVWLTGGNHGETAVFLVRITTDGLRTLERSFSVDVIDNAITIPAETEVERLTREITEAKAQRALVALGKAVITAQRDGRLIRRLMPTLAELEAHIRQLEGELFAAQVAAGVDATPRRTAIGTGYA